MNEMFDDLQNLIKYLRDKHIDITNEWLNEYSYSINYKKKLVTHIDVDGDIYNSVIDYVKFLTQKTPGIVLQLSDVCSNKVSARVKALNSIEYKIQNYKTSGHAFGKIPINKCLNDLFGIRIILEDYIDYGEIVEYLKKEYLYSKYKCINSSKGNYKAAHFYFIEGSKSFPWELQIWNKCDVESNLASHKQHKQEYTNWEKESKEGGIIND